MIKYNLQCSNHHTFEGWFDDSESFLDQLEKKLVSCPFCACKEVSQALSTPNIISNYSKTRDSRVDPLNPDINPGKQRASQQTLDQRGLTDLDYTSASTRAKIQYVGSKFTQLAKDMHDNTIKKRPIAGTATNDQINELLDHGVKFYKIELEKKMKN